MESIENEKEVLITFLSFSLTTSKSILDKFSELDGAIVHLDGGKNNFVYIPGKRKDRVLLVAHSDTVWDTYYSSFNQLEPKDPNDVSVDPAQHKPIEQDGLIIQGGNGQWGIGADDRAGCAMLWLLRNSGHSLLITDGEEHGQIGAYYIKEQYPEISAELNSHQYVIQLDLHGNNYYKTYRLPVTKEFCQFIEENTQYEDAGKNARTDIIALCTDICGVNLSVGYYKEHTPNEKVVYDEWFHTLELLRNLLQKEQPQFNLDFNQQKNQCTYATHGMDYISQKWYHCKTCGLVGNLGCCELCSKVCHQGHDIEYSGILSSCYCDCGAGDGKFPCKCLRPV